MPPLRPASRASSLVHSCAVPFWCAAFPPLLAISRCLVRSIDANPRSSLATVLLLPGTYVCPGLLVTRRAREYTGCNACTEFRRKQQEQKDLGKHFPSIGGRGPAQSGKLPAAEPQAASGQQ